MIFLPSHTRVFLAPGATDMRKAINGLSIMVQAALDKDPFSGHLFAFCNRRRNMIKVLYYDRNGFCLWHKRLEKHRFTWPATGEQVKTIGTRELGLLLDGLDIRQIDRHDYLPYSILV